MCHLQIEDCHNQVHNAIQQKSGQNDCSTCDASIVRSARADIPVFCLQVVQRTNPAAAPSGGAKSLARKKDDKWLRLLRRQCADPLHSTSSACKITGTVQCQYMDVTP